MFDKTEYSQTDNLNDFLVLIFRFKACAEQLNNVTYVSNLFSNINNVHYVMCVRLLIIFRHNLGNYSMYLS